MISLHEWVWISNMTKLPYRTARSVIQRNGMPFFTIQWTEIRLYMVEIIVIVNRMNGIFENRVRNIFWFGRCYERSAHGKPSHSNVRCKNNVSKKWKIKFIFFLSRSEICFSFYHFDDQSSIALKWFACQNECDWNNRHCRFIRSDSFVVWFEYKLS